MEFAHADPVPRGARARWGRLAPTLLHHALPGIRARGARSGPGDPWHSNAAGPRAGSHSRRLHCHLCQLAVDLFHQHSHWHCRCDPCHPVLTRGSRSGTQPLRPARLHHRRLRSGCTALRVLGNDDCWLGIREGARLPVQRGALVDRLYRHRDHHGQSRRAAAP